MNVIPEMLRVH